MRQDSELVPVAARRGCGRRLGLAALLALLGCHAAPSAPPTPPTLPPVVTQRFGDVTIHALQTGWVRVKTAHRDLSGPEATRMLAILLDARWTPWMPVTSYAIEHPEGVFLVDTGLSERMLDDAHFACDPGTAFVYRNLLRFSFAPEDRIDRRLAGLGIDPARVRGVVLTHRHADHTDGLDHLPASAPVYIGEEDWPDHNGALLCRWPAGRTPRLVGHGGEAIDAMVGSMPLTRDGAVRVVPLRGHSPGHLGLFVRLRDRRALFIGDSAFDVAQLEARRLAGIVERPAEARQTLEVVRQQLGLAPTFLLPAHDPESLLRFQRGEVTSLSR